MGGRLLPDQEGLPAAQFMYEDSSGRRLTLYVRKETGLNNTSFRFYERDGFGSFYWIDRPLAYALSGRLSRDELSEPRQRGVCAARGPGQRQGARRAGAGAVAGTADQVGRGLVLVVHRHAIAVAGLDARLDARVVAQALDQPAAEPDDGDDHHQRGQVLAHAHAVVGIVGRLRAGVGGSGTGQRRRRRHRPRWPQPGSGQPRARGPSCASCLR